MESKHAGKALQLFPRRLFSRLTIEMSDYHVIESRSLDEDDDSNLHALVNEWLAAGYVTVGGVAVTVDSMYLQAVMKPAARGGRRSLRKSGKSRKTQRRSRR